MSDPCENCGKANRKTCGCNKRRRESALKALEPYNFKTEKDSAVCDLLTDLRHLCQHKGLDMAELIDRSEYHFREEV